VEPHKTVEKMLGLLLGSDTSVQISTSQALPEASKSRPRPWKLTDRVADLHA
jgi:hypothetical protein